MKLKVDIYEHAIRQDSILLMPTGTGKTYIAILLIKHMAPKLGPEKKTAVFVVDRSEFGFLNRDIIRR